MQCINQKLKSKPKLLQCVGPKCKDRNMQGPGMQCSMVKLMHLNEMIYYRTYVQKSKTEGLNHKILQLKHTVTGLKSKYRKT